MRFRPQTWLLLSVLLFLAGGITWHLADKESDRRAAAAAAQRATAGQTNAPASNSAPTNSKTGAAADRFRYRLANTTQTVGQLTRSDRAILLENALIDTATGKALSIPPQLRATGEPGSYIVQARGPVDAAFRARLSAAGATIVSYIPNNAYLVRASAAAAKSLAAYAQAVLPYEPYYKLSPQVLGEVMEQPHRPPDSALAVVVFPDARAAAIVALQKLGAQVMAE